MLSGGYKMMNGSRVHKLFREAIKESLVRESTKLAVDERVDKGESWRFQINSIRSSAMSDVFIVVFISLPHF